MTYRPLHFPAAELPQGHTSLRSEVRAFFASQAFTPRCDGWLAGHDLEFSRGLAERGWVGMTFPIEYGGHGWSATEPCGVVGDLLAAGETVEPRWVADGQTVPDIMRTGT